jgi:hypothetical protein
VTSTLFASERRSALDTHCGDLVLRIANSPRKGQIVRLRSTKCTIGSGRDCTLRLHARGVAPVHCLVVRGRARTIVRRWSADTRLNDRAFTDSLLTSGDRLGIGPIELEVVDIGATAIDQEPERDFEETRRGADQRSKDVLARLTEIRVEQDALALERSGLETERDAFAEERRQWTAEQERTLREIDEQCGQLTARLAQFDAERNSLVAERNDLQIQRDAVAEERRQWNAQRETTTQDIDKNSEQITARMAQLEAERNALSSARNDLETQQDALAEERRQWQAQRETTAQDIDKNSEQVAARMAELEAEQTSLSSARTDLEAQRNALTEERRRWEAERDQAMQQIDARRVQLAADAAKIEASLRAAVVEHGGSEVQQDAQPVDVGEAPPSETPELEFQEPTERSPVDLNEVFRRVGAKVDLSEEEPASATAEEAPVENAQRHPTAGSASTRVTASSATSSQEESEAGEEESIEDYMQRLMQRVRVTSGEVESPARPAHRAEPIRTREASPSASSDAPSNTVSEAEPIEPIRPRAPAPAKPINMDALREVANLSAESAIGQHTRRTLVRTMRGKLFSTTVALTVSAGLFWLWWRFGTSEIALYSSTAAIIVAALWGLQYVSLIGRLIGSRKGHDTSYQGNGNDRPSSD